MTPKALLTLLAGGLVFGVGCTEHESAEHGPDAKLPLECEDDGPAAPGVGGPFAQFLVGPYLQQTDEHGTWVLWELEGDTELEAKLEWGCSLSLPHRMTAPHRPGPDGTTMFEALIAGLAPDTEYWYRLVTEAGPSEVMNFRTLPERASETSVRFVAMSDMQPPGAGPELDRWKDLVESGVVSLLASEGKDVASLSAVLIAGDLVDAGGIRDQWANAFFPGVRSLGGHVSLLPVPGNHEYAGAATSQFFDYFKLPENGAQEFAEHFWFKDLSNLRIIGLDSNGSYQNDVQLAWLGDVLDEACKDDHVDFVIAQLHHPYKSELWPDGEISWSGEVASRLDDFATRCDKPALSFFGHTHGYNRGISRDHAHLWLNVASAAGDIDYVGEFANVDYTEMSVVYDEYGFVYGEATAGENPTLRLRYVSRGDGKTSFDNVQRDEVTVRRHNTRPEKPVLPEALGTIDPLCPTLPRGTFVDGDGDSFGASRVQLATSCLGLDSPLVDVWWQSQNVWDDVDTMTSMDPERPALPATLESGKAYCYRVKVRDSAFAWSDWSSPRELTTAREAGEPSTCVSVKPLTQVAR
jgi:hypothetical protein